MLLFSLLVNLVDVGIVMLTVSRFVKYRFQNIKLSFISVCTFLAIINTAIQLKIEKTPAAILSSVVVIIALLFCFKKLKWYFALPVLIWALEMAYELFSISVICAIAHTLSPNVALSNERLIYFATFLSRLLFIISCLLLFIYKKKNLFRISKQVNIFQCLLMVTGMMLLYCLFDIFNRIISKAELPSPIAILISIIVLVFFLILVFVLFYKMQIDAKKDKEFALKEQYEIMSQDAVKQLSFMMEKILNVRHDLNKKLNIMYYLTGTNESESAIQFYDEIEHDVQSADFFVSIYDRKRNFIKRELLVSSKPHEREFYKYLGKTEWIAEDEIALYSEDGQVFHLKSNEKMYAILVTSFLGNLFFPRSVCPV